MENGSLWITTHDGKMHDIPSIGTPCCCNERCRKNAAIKGSICEKCYADRILGYRDSLLKHLEDNYNVLTHHLLTAAEMPFFNNAFVRGESFGDVDTVNQAINYIEIVRNNPQVSAFTFFTKNPDIYAAAFKDHPKPSNMIIIVSSLFINQVSTAWKKYDFIDGVFTVFTAEYAISHNIEINCGSRSCIGCRRCYTKHEKLVFTNEILKEDQPKYYKLLQKMQQQNH